MGRFTRRSVLGAGAAAAALACSSTGNRTSAGPLVIARKQGRPCMVGSANGFKSMEAAWSQLEGGADPLDAALAVVQPVEADPSDASVGLGGLPNEEGKVVLDAAVMDGETHNSGAVACDREHPPSLWRSRVLVMERTDHCLHGGSRRLRLRPHATGIRTPSS